MSPSPLGDTLADEKQPGLEAKLEPFRGRWTTSREKKEDEKVNRYELFLEFKDGEPTWAACQIDHSRGFPCPEREN